jgi:purine-binding chemotaxis protein CheW
MASNLARRASAAALAAQVAGGQKRSKHQRDRGQGVKYLAFRLAGNIYAAPVALIREILTLRPITPVPRAPAAIMGIISVRGQLVTVLDLRRRLRLAESPTTNKARMLLVDPTGVEQLGLFVDEVLQVYRLSESEIEHTASALGGEVASYIAGIARPAQAQTQAEAKGQSKSASVVRQDASVIILLDLKVVLAS